MRSSDEGWVRIGRYDRAGRRSTWARLEPVEGPPWLLAESNIAAVELCSGREGDDAYVRVAPPNPAFDPLLDVILYSVGNIDDSEQSEGHTE